MCFTINRLKGLQADKTQLGSTRLGWVQIKNKVKLLFCKLFQGSQGDNVGLCGKGDQSGSTKTKNNYTLKLIWPGW